MTAHDFAAQHGDPTNWTTADFETCQNLAEVDTLPDFTLYMRLPDPAPEQPAA